MQVFTSSRGRAFRACQKLHYYRYVQGYVCVVEKGARRFGTLFHKCVEKYWLAGLNGDWRTGTEAAMAKTVELGLDPNIDPFDLAKLRAMVFAYCTRWDVRRVGYIDSVLGVERSYRLPMINPDTGHPSRTFERGGKVDVKVLLCDGRKAVIEHKTSSESAEPGSTYRTRLLLDPQVSEYFDAMDVSVVIYDVAVKPGQEPLKKSENLKYTEEKSRVCVECKKARVCKECKKKKPLAPPPHVNVIEIDGEEKTFECQDGRVVVPAPHTLKIEEEGGSERVLTCVNGKFITDPGGRLYANLRDQDETPEEYEVRCLQVIDSDIEKYLQDLEVVRLEHERREYLLDTWNTALQARVSERTGVAVRNPDACFKYGTQCDFWEVCTGTASLNDPTKYKRIVDVNPELKEEESAA